MDEHKPSSDAASPFSDEFITHLIIGIGWILFIGLAYLVGAFLSPNMKSLGRLRNGSRYGLVMLTDAAPTFYIGNNSLRTSPLSRESWRRKRDRLAFWWIGSKHSLAWQITSVALSVTSCVIFVVLAIRVAGVRVKASDDPQIKWDSTEYDQIFEQPWLIWTEFSISMFFLAEYFLFFYLAVDKLRYIISILALIDLFTVTPALVGVVTGFYFYGFEFLRFARILYSIRYLQNAGWLVVSNVAGHLMYLFAVLVTFLFTSASFIFVAENSVVNRFGQISNLAEALYFIMVSFTTVGYGDIVVTSYFSRGILIAMVTVGVVVLSTQLERVVTIVRERNSRGRMRFTGSGHVVVHSRVPQVLDFFDEFYHDTHSCINVQSVLMLPDGERLPTEIEHALSETLQFRVFHLTASALNGQDLARANTGAARHIFLLADRYAQDRDQEDARLILEALAFRKSHPQIPLSVQVLSEKHVGLLADAGIEHPLCVDQVRMGILAQAVVCPGFSTYVTNLICSVSLPAPAPQAGAFGNDIRDLPNDYYAGLGKRLYLIRDLSSYAAMTYSETAMLLYREFGVLLIGLAPRPGYETPAGETHIALGTIALATLSSMVGVREIDSEQQELISNPGHGYRMTCPRVKSLYGIAIANSAAAVRETETFDHRNLEPDTLAILRRFKQQRSEESICALHDEFVRKVSPFKIGLLSSQSPDPRADSPRHDLSDDNGLFEPPLILERDVAGYSTLDHRTTPTAKVGEQGFVESWYSSKHVLVLGDSASDIVTFVERLRSYSTKELKPILIMTPHGLPPLEASKMAEARQVFQILGRSTDEHDCVRAGMHVADTVVILGSASNTDLSVDAKSATTFHRAKSGTAFPIVDLACAQNAASIGPLATVDYMTNPYYAAGQVFTSSCLERLICQTYSGVFHLQTICSLLSGQVFSVHVEDHLSEYAQQSVAKLFGSLLQRDLLLLGLYRCHPETPLRYVVCAPDPSLLIFKSDIVYVLDTSNRTGHSLGRFT